MGLDMYLGAYQKAKLEKTVFNTEESEKLREWDNDYSIFAECPNVFKNIATEIKVVNQYYNMKKISDDFANGEELTIGGFSCEKIFFRNYQKNIKLDLDVDILPTSSGFFFGRTEYDDYYFEQLKYTVEICKKVITETDWENEVVVYHESW